jgi:16S rRNA (guanine527-N7)-methyltransferase
MRADEPEPLTGDLNEFLAEAGLTPAPPEIAAKFLVYLKLLLHWNQRMNLSAIRDAEGIVRRHFIESIVCARALPSAVKTALDFGSGAGFPGIPIALCRPEIAVTLAESQGKKAAFLRETVRQLGISAEVYAARAETLQRQFDCVAMRAVDGMERAVAAAVSLVGMTGWLAVLTTRKDLAMTREAAGPGMNWQDPIELASSDERILALARRDSAR